MGALAKEVRRIRTLERAWQIVRSNGEKSKSKRTRAEIDDFASKAPSHLRSIQNELSRERFRFEPARGYAEPPSRPGKAPRPIVITPVRSRVVQRAILDVLCNLPAIKQYIEQPFSFGGIRRTDPNAEAAVPGAIKACVSEFNRGNTYFIRSDIAGFFRKIPKEPLRRMVRSAADDDEFHSLFSQGIDVELENLAELRENIELFPKHDVGVAQGCSLSPLLGNMLLSDFDQKLNQGNCSCIRYIDDFILLGPNADEINRRFDLARSILDSFGMDAYHPDETPDKAEAGNVQSSVLTFLGVELHNGSIRPSAKNRGALISSMNEIIEENVNCTVTDQREKKYNYERSFLRCLNKLNAVISGWGNQYYFCNDKQFLEQVDERASEMLRSCFTRFRSRWAGLGYLGRRRMMGVKSLLDCKSVPLLWASRK